MPNWPNPWSDAVPITLDELKQCSYSFAIIADVLPDRPVDAYLLEIEGQPWISAGLRFGAAEPEYMSLLCDQNVARELIDRHKMEG